MDAVDFDAVYRDLILHAIRISADYRPKLGRGRQGDVTAEQFITLYHADVLYHWFGLDSPLMYRAHRAAGGMTSLYRQIGLGCQWLFQRLLQDRLGQSAVSSRWTYTVPTPDGKGRTLALDGRIVLNEVVPERRPAITTWLQGAATVLEIDAGAISEGAVFEIRQGYKSKDAKRQQGDLANAANAYAHRYLPVIGLFSNQIDSDVAARYLRARWLLLSGTRNGTIFTSLYVFARDVLGYDLADFFERHTAEFQQEVRHILETLLTSE